MHTLTTKEKAAYKKHLLQKTANRDSLLYKLFSALENEKNGIDKTLVGKLGIKSPAQFSTLKKTLYADITGMLVCFYKKQNQADSSFHEEMKIEFLLSRKLFEQAYKFIVTEIKNAEKRQDLVALLHLHKMKYRYLELNENKYNTRSIALQQEEIKNVLTQVFHFEQIQLLFQKAIQLKNITNVRTAEKEIAEAIQLKDEILKIKYTAGPAIIQLYQNTALAICTYLSGEYTLCEHFCNQVISLWKQHKNLTCYYAQLFKEGASVVFYNDFMNPQIENVISHFNFFKEYLQFIKNENEKGQVQLLFYNTEIKIFHKQTQYGELHKYLQVHEKNIRLQAGQYGSPKENMIILASLAISYFVLEQYAKADELLYEIKEINRLAQKDDIFYFTLVFHLLVIFKREEWVRLYSMCEAGYQSLYSRKKIRPFEKELMLFLKNLQIIHKKEYIKKSLGKLLTRLELYKNDPVKKRYFLYFNYYAWLQSLKMGIRYTDFLQQQKDT